MILKLGKNLGETMMSNLINLVSENPSNTERVLGDSIQRSWKMESLSIFIHSPMSIAKDLV